MTASNRKRIQEPEIVVPKPTDDQPRYGRVGAIAAVGFVIGVAWPALARVQLAPVPPADVSAESSAGEMVAAPQLGGVTPGSTASATPVREAPPASAPIGPKVRLAEVLTCVDADGKKHQKCDAPRFDSVLTEPLKSLLACDGAAGQTGVLSLGFDVDFGHGALGHFTVGRSTTLDPALARSLAECAKGRLSSLELASVEHNFGSYRVFYLVEFTRLAAESGKAPSAPDVSAEAASAAGSAEGDVQGQSGRATVAWDVAIVRKAPKDGAILARVLGGTRVIVTGRQGDWFRIKYNASGDEGFVFKSAIGL
jgi:hypothetical protein